MSTIGEMHVEPALPMTPQVDPTSRYANSMLFRKSACLAGVLALALPSQGSTPFRVLSVGSSYGPEVDSIGALLSFAGIQDAHITGVDSDGELIAAAEQGRYRRIDELGTKEMVRQAGELTLLGFEVSIDRDEYIIDAQPVRQKHTVRWVEADMVHGDFTVSPAHLIMCNNVLPFVAAKDVDNASAMVGRMVSNLAPGGILSITAEAKFFDDQLDTGGIASYAEWHETIAAALQDNHGPSMPMTPVLYNASGAAVTFQKAS